MNFIWLPLIQAIQNGYAAANIHYKLKDKEDTFTVDGEKHSHGSHTHRISPLFEYMPTVLFDPNGAVPLGRKIAEVDINPYHRFGEIFNHIILPDRDDPNDPLVFDAITHILAHIDRICGMSKRDFQIIMIMKGLEDGSHGETDDHYGLFTFPEKRAVAEALLGMYETANCLRTLDRLLSTIMPECGFRIKDNEEAVFYSRLSHDEKEEKKLRYLIKFFLPIGHPHVIHWRNTYGTVGYEKGMALEEFVL